MSLPAVSAFGSGPGAVFGTDRRFRPGFITRTELLGTILGADTRKKKDAVAHPRSGPGPAPVEERPTGLSPHLAPRAEEEWRPTPPPLGIAPRIEEEWHPTPPPLGIAPGVEEEWHPTAPPLGLSPGVEREIERKETDTSMGHQLELFEKQAIKDKCYGEHRY